jgi:predicted permease
MFFISLQNVLLTLAYIIPGFILCKVKKARADHLSTMSAVLIYFCSPCMIINSFLQLDFSLVDLGNMGLFFVTTLILQILFMGIMFIFLRKKYAEAKYRILTIASISGNVGFFGLPIVKAMLPDNPVVMCYSAVYVLSMNLLIFTIGVFCLTNDKKYMSIKCAVFNPTTAGAAIGLILYLFSVKIYLPDIVLNAVSLCGSMTTPLCMFILGIRLATVNFKALFTRPFIYIICLFKLIVFPLFCYGLVYFIPFDQAFKASILILSSVPCASVILNLAEMHHAEEELSANCVLLSTLFCFATIPVLALIL